MRVLDDAQHAFGDVVVRIEVRCLTADRAGLFVEARLGPVERLGVHQAPPAHSTAAENRYVPKRCQPQDSLQSQPGIQM